MKAHQCSSPGGLSTGVRPGRTGCLSERLGRKAMILGRQDGVGDTTYHARTTPEDQERSSARSQPLPDTFVGPKAGTLWGGISPSPRSQRRSATCLPAKTRRSSRLGNGGKHVTSLVPIVATPSCYKGRTMGTRRGRTDQAEDNSSHHKLEGEVRLGREVISPGGSALRVARATHHESPGNPPCSSTMILSTSMQE